MADPHQILRTALEHHRAGEFDEAARAYGALVQAAATSAPAARLLAMIALQTGQEEAAVGTLERFLSNEPESPELLYLLGMVELNRGDLNGALVHLQSARLASPDAPRIHEALGRVRLGQGRLDDAQSSFEQALALDSDLVQAHSGMGRVHMGRRQWSESEACFARALRLKPDDPAVLHNLGSLYLRSGRYVEAETQFERAVAQSSDLCAAWCALTDVRIRLRDLPGAVDAGFGAVRCDAKEWTAHDALGRALEAHGRFDEAIASFQVAMTLAPEAPAPPNNMAMLYWRRGDYDTAGVHMERAMAIGAELPETWNNRGLISLDSGNPQEALSCFERAIQLSPNHVSAQLNRAHVLWSSGCLDETIDALKRALERNPGNPDLGSRLIMAMHYSHRYAPSRLRRAAEEWGESMGVAPSRPDPSDPDPNRPLRIGFVSADLRQHPVGKSMDAVTRAYASSANQVFLYLNHDQRDALTTSLAAASDGLLDVTGLTDVQLAEQIQRDGIDVLVDLSGHTAGHRLGLFAMRPAPIQLTWIGFFGTTGLTCFDGCIGNDDLFPLGAEKDVVEPLIRLDRSPFVIGAAAFPNVPLTPPPSLMQDQVIFGCFNNPLKLNLDVVRLWVRTLHEIPDSQLLMRYPSLELDQGAQRLRSLFDDAGLAPERLLLEPAVAHADVFSEYGRVDISLDPFPVNGGMTTLEALWMGVPVLCLAGDRQSSRLGQTVLRAVGHGDWVSADADAFVSKAVQLAGDTAERTRLRRVLRGELQASDLMDGAALVTGLDDQIRVLWKQACAGTLP